MEQRTSKTPVDTHCLTIRIDAPADEITAESHDVVRIALGARSAASSAGKRTITDTFEQQNASCVFGSIQPAEQARQVTFEVVGEYRIEKPSAGGWLLLPADERQLALWLPHAPALRRLDTNDRILEECSPELKAFSATGHGTSISFRQGSDWRLDWVTWHLPAELAEQLESLAPVEQLPLQLWGSHTGYRKPSDLYTHLKGGWIYENRYAWPHKWRICSENDAHALYVTLAGLEKSTGKTIYGLLKSQVVLSVLARQSGDGSWRHGEWTRGMERHFRLHCSGMHLLMDYLEQEKDEAVLPALSKAAAFISAQRDELEDGAWFLHDELEKSAAGMKEAPFNTLKSHAFGKSENNMLVLNTQLDTFVAVQRYTRITGEPQYEKLLAGATAATRKVLAARPADWLYRPLFKAIELTLLPTPVASHLPAPVRAMKRIAWKYLVPALPWIKVRFPRLVLPGGYIDRELSLQLFAHSYLGINLMDLLRYHRQTGDKLSLEVALDGIRFGQRLRIWERWQENPRQAYASGFWAEALFHLCVLRPDAHYRVWLYKAVLFLDNHDQGVSPSLLGANSEAVTPEDQAGLPAVDSTGIRTVNLSSNGFREFLFINLGKETLPWPEPEPSEAHGLKWSLAPFETDSNTPPSAIPPFGCVRASDRRRA